MLVSEQYETTFVHIPKTGGTSLASALLSQGEAFNRLPERIERHQNYVKNPSEWTIKHSRMHELDEKYQNFFCFAFVRNPWDLMVSCFSWWTQNTKLQTRKEYGRDIKEKGFKAFIKSNSSCLNECYHDNQGQSYWLNDNIDFIGRYENLQQDFNTVCDKIWIQRQTLPHINKTNHKHYSEYYDDESREIVAKNYARDIERFGYKFGE